MSRAERVKAIVLLLQHRLDYLESAIRVAQSFPSKPGAVPHQKVACGCARLEYRVEADRRVPHWVGDPSCLLCHGDGFRGRLSIDAGHTQDERGIVFDPMTYAHDRSTKTGKVPLRCMDRAEYDRELARLREDERTRSGVRSKREAYGWERARERRDRSGSFRELDRALDALFVAHPGLHALVCNVFKGVYGEGRIPAGAGAAYWQALLFLEARMPCVIRVPQFIRDRDGGQRRREDVAATYRRTLSIAKTARTHNLRKDRTKRILAEAGLIAA